jgi:Spy/CpxP family protein refolding chaperone
MKKLFLLLFASVALSVSAQQEGPRGPQRQGGASGMMQKKEIEVKPEHKDAFEALKKEYYEAKKELRAKYSGEMPKRGEKPTEEQMDANMKKHMAYSKALVELNEKYYPKFREILTPMQAAQFLQLWGNSFNQQRQGMPGKQGQQGQRERRNQN